MNNAKRRRFVTALLASSVLAPTAAFTYTLLNPVRHWLSTPVRICVQGPGHVSVTSADLDQGVTATLQALNGTHLLAGTGWNVTPVGAVTEAVMVSPEAVSAGVCSASWKLGDGKPTIAFDEKIKGTCSGSCLAATFIGYYHCNDPLHPDGHCAIDDADVETRRNKSDRLGGPYYSLYESGCTRGGEWNLEAIMVHEVGHVLGLGHSADPSATMYPSVSSCNASPATIASDDILGLGALY